VPVPDSGDGKSLEECRLGVGRNLACRSVWWVFIVDVCALWRRSGLSLFGVAWVDDEFAPATVQLLNRFGDGNPPIAEHGEGCFDASEISLTSRRCDCSVSHTTSAIILGVRETLQAR
jgi:hypothetical protein